MMANEQTKQTIIKTNEHTEQTTLKTVCSYVTYVKKNIRSSIQYVKKNICPSVPYVKKNICSFVPYVSNCLACLACLLFVCPVCSQSIHEFTPAEQQSISVPTPGLFDRSDAFSIDFTDVPKDEYSFPLPVGKAELVNNNSELEISTTKGDAVKAMFPGVVRLSKHNAPFGNVIVIRHDNGLETVYGYNAQNLVHVGDKVKAGQTIAIVGGEGLKTFCNFAIMVNGRRITPSIILEVNGHKLHQQTITFRRNGHRIEVKTHRVRDNMTDFKADPFANGNTIKWNLADMKSSQWSYPLPGAHVRQLHQDSARQRTRHPLRSSVEEPGEGRTEGEGRTDYRPRWPLGPRHHRACALRNLLLWSSLQSEHPLQPRRPQAAERYPHHSEER